MNRQAAFLLLIILASPAAFAAKSVTIRGLVTYVDSAHQFRVDDTTIVCGTTTVVRSEGETATPVASCADIQIGISVEVKGKADRPFVHATRISVSDPPVGVETVGGTALLDREPSLRRDAEGWTGTIPADGRTLRLTPATTVELDSSLASLADLHPNTFITYSGTTNAAGEVLLQRATFAPNAVQDGEAELAAHWESRVTQPDFARASWGLIEFPNDKLRPLHPRVIGKAPILPNEFIQNRITEIGLSLVPAFQREFPENDPRKVHFRFYVVKMDYQTLAIPTGTILVSVAALQKLQNEAQIAALLARSVATVLQEQQRRTQARANTHVATQLVSLGISEIPLAGLAAYPALGLPEGISWSKYVSWLNEQTDRISLGYLLQGGWDIREAPRAMRLLSGRDDDGELRPSSKVPSSRHLLQEIRRQYSQTDFRKLKTGDHPYNQIQHHLTLPIAAGKTDQ